MNIKGGIYYYIYATILQEQNTGNSLFYLDFGFAEDYVWEMDWKRNILRSDAGRLLPEKARELIRKAEHDFVEVVRDIRGGERNGCRHEEERDDWDEEC